jgi:hypothetical protein
MKLFPSAFIIFASSTAVTTVLSSDIAITKTSLGLGGAGDDEHHDFVPDDAGKWQLEVGYDPTCGNPTPPPVTYQCCYKNYRLQSLCCYISTGYSWYADSYNKAGCLPPAGEESIATEEEQGDAVSSSDIAITKTSLGLPDFVPDDAGQRHFEDEYSGVAGCGSGNPQDDESNCCTLHRSTGTWCCYYNVSGKWEPSDSNPVCAKDKEADEELERSFLRGGDTDPSARKPYFCIDPDFSCYKTSDGFPPCCLHYQNCPVKRPACDLDEEEVVTATNVVGRVDGGDHHDHVQPEEMQWLEDYDYTCGNPTPPPAPYQCCYFSIGLNVRCCYRSTGSSWTASVKNASGCIQPAGESVATEEERGEVSFLRSG